MRFQIFLPIFFLCLPCNPVLAQNTQPAQSHRAETNRPIMEEEETTRMTNDMMKKAAKERAVALKNDTDKLLKLSVELKQYVDKSDANVLSLDVIKKAEEIEKLAKSVKDKMTGPN